MLSIAYIEDYHYIKLIIHESEVYLIDIDNLFLTNNDGVLLKLSIFKTEQFDQYYHIHTTFKGRVVLNHDHYINVKDNQQIHLNLGKIMRTERFDVEHYYSGPLGVEYHPDYTIFRMWSPVAKQLNVVLTKDETKTIPLHYIDKGLWEVKVDGDLENYLYHYEVRVNTTWKIALDPYARSSNANSTENYVIDWNKTYQMQHHNNLNFQNYLDTIIYEVHLKDVNMEHLDSNYLAFINRLAYYKDLGITHLQIMPINAFGGVDETDKESRYNWGYNPVEFNVPSGWHSSDPHNAYTRVNELKKMIDEIHHQGLKVNLDVVYNHVYDAKSFSMNRFVPGYVYRTDEQGFMTNGSGCGNDLASERRMNRRFIVDSLKYWVENYDIDGFRFDLMGLLDYETLILAETELKKIKPDIMLYGEGWNLPTALPASKRATIFNNWALLNYAYFNDLFRNLMRGEPHNNQGYIYNQNSLLEEVKFVIKGSSNNGTFLNSPSQSINYVECHDNLTFYDKLCKDKYMLEEIDRENYVILSLGLVVLSLGIPFIHAGEELSRTKKGIDNSYNLDLDINGLSYDVDKYQKQIEALKFFINFRKHQKIYHNNDAYIIEKELKITSTLNNTIVYETKYFMVVFKNNKTSETITLEQTSKLIFNGVEKTDLLIDSLNIDAIGVYIVQK